MPNSQTISANVQLVEYTYFGMLIEGMSSFVDQCREEFKKKPVFKTITLQPYKNPTFTLNPSHLERLERLSFKISVDSIAKLTHAMLSITTDPFLLAENLKDLDVELGKEMNVSDIRLSTERPGFDFIIAGSGHYIPGPPASDYKPKKKGRLLDKLLLHRERSVGINTDGGTPKFVGSVSHELADAFIAQKKHNFSEDEQVSRLLLHGKYSHRLILEAFRFASIHEDYALSFPQLLELLVTVKHENSSLWELICDTAKDVIEPIKSENKLQKACLNPDYYNFSSRFPFVFKSLILCFGQQIGLANLQCYLLDSHWKESYRMVGRVMENNNDLEKNRVYTYCMEALGTIHPVGDLGCSFPFTLSDEHAKAHPKYQPYYDGLETIVKKVSEPHSGGEYHSWDDYILQTKDIPYISPEAQFLEACCSSSGDSIRILIKKQDNKDEIRRIIWRGLQLAIENHKKEVVAALLNEKILTPKELERFIVELAHSGQNEVIKLFLDAGVTINFANNGSSGVCVIRSPLIAAVKAGQYDTVVFLLRHGINFERERSPSHLNTALITAIKYGHKNIAQLLLEQNPSQEWLCAKNADQKNAYELLREKQGMQWNELRLKFNALLAQNSTVLNLRNYLKEQLNDYINRIKILQNKTLNHGFYFFQQPHIMNVQADYLLAQSLLQQLNEDKPLGTIFTNIKEQRNQLIQRNELDEHYIRDLNSTRLNNIIVTAQKYLKAHKVIIEKSQEDKGCTNFIPGKLRITLN